MPQFSYQAINESGNTVTGELEAADVPAAQDRLAAMMEEQQRARRQKGFTLIEIIAVLVILGILAVVAIPKFFDMQKNARDKAAEGLVSAAMSQLSLAYASAKLNGTNVNSLQGSTVCSTSNLTVSNSAAENSNINCDGTLDGNVNITANVGVGTGQQGTASAVWKSPDLATGSAS